MQPVITALNHLLTQNTWTLQRLARFAGRTARFNLLPLSFACTIQADGLLAPAGRDACADAVCTVPPALLPRLALGDNAALGLIQSSGDAGLIEEIVFLARNLRWDAAEDLSRVTGDIAAERIVQAAQGLHRHVRQTAANLSGALAEYWTEERPLIAKPGPIASFSTGVARLRDSLEALDKRIQQMSEGR